MVWEFSYSIQVFPERKRLYVKLTVPSGKIG
jgi:hypothetical protein